MKARPALPDEPLREAYRQHNNRQLSRSIIVANAIALVGMPSGVLLDYFLYPERFALFAAIRFGVDALLLAIMGILHLRRHHPARPLVSSLGILSLLLMTASFSLMISLTEGERSPYFAGIILVLLTWSSLLPWSVAETLIMCLGSLAIYTVGCLTSPGFSLPASLPLFGFNTSFILITTLVCIGVTLFLSRVRFEDFRLRHQLDVQNRELQELDRQKTQFFANISHELRTPLTLILSPVESLLSRPDQLDARVHESLILVHRNSLRLLKLINDLLDLTRLDQGGDVLRRQTFAVGPFVRGIVDSVRHLGLTKNLRLRVEDGDPATLLTADASRIEKVLVNLLTNAIKYTPAGGSIVVAWHAAGQNTALVVRDTGVGIPAEDLPRIFDRFHQVRSNLTNQTQGVGIGLALARELVEEHGGHIEVESQPGHGSTFRVLLPLESGAAVTPAPAAPSGPEEPFAQAFRSADRAVRPPADPADELPPILGQGETTVLVADDEIDLRRFVTALLAEDHRIVQTPHGGNVLDLAAEHEPDLILLDWMMPGKDGLTLCRELRASPLHRDAKIMLLTARIDERSKLDALAAGADDFLTKPFSSAEVKNRVANLVRAARLQRDLRTRNDELRATLEKLQRTESLLIQSEKMNAIGSLSAGLLHEINNPLNYTLTAISLVHQFRDTLTPDLRELLADIEEGMGRIRDVITDLRTFAHPESPDHLTVFPLLDAIRAAQKIAAGELRDCTVDLAVSAELLVSGQRTQLTHVFINLFDNAAKALAAHPPAAGARIRISAETRGEFLALTFVDNGPGIPPAILTRIFDPFFTTREVGAGMGLGLSICHTILQAHGGSITAGNDPAGGARFLLQIPTARETLQPC